MSPLLGFEFHMLDASALDQDHNLEEFEKR